MAEEEDNMKKEEWGLKKKGPSLPPNYVSLALLQERWLQRKREEEEGRQKAQAESRNRENLKPVKGILENPLNSKNTEPVIVGNQVSNHRVDSRLKGKELYGFAGANGMGKSVHRWGNKEVCYKKKTQGVKNGRKGEDKSYGLGEIVGEEDSDRIQGENRYCYGSFEGTASVCMVDVVPETVNKEFKPEKLISKSGGNMRWDRKNLRNNGDCGVEASGSKDKVKGLAENAMRKEDSGVFGVKKFPAYGGGLEQNGGDDDDFMVEVVHENMVKNGVLVGTESSKGSEQFGGEVERKGRKLKVPKDKKNPQVEDEVLIGYNGRNLQQGRRGKEVQVYRRREGVSEDSGTSITGSFRGLSLDYSGERKVTSRMGIHRGKGHYKMYGRNWEMQNPADNRFVWVKKGEICDTNVAEFDISAYDKNPEEHVHNPTLIPDDAIPPKSEKYCMGSNWHGVFVPSSDGADSVLEEKAFFHRLEDLEKPEPQTSSSVYYTMQ